MQELTSLVDRADDFSSNFETIPIELVYSDFKFDDIMRAVIPDELLNDNVNVKSYSVIGHIAHFNLRDKILDYKTLIGKFETFKILKNLKIIFLN